MSRYVYVVSWSEQADVPERYIFGTAARALSEFVRRAANNGMAMVDDDDNRLSERQLRKRYLTCRSMHLHSIEDCGDTWVAITKEVVQ